LNKLRLHNQIQEQTNSFTLRHYDVTKSNILGKKT